MAGTGSHATADQALQCDCEQCELPIVSAADRCCAHLRQPSPTLSQAIASHRLSSVTFTAFWRVTASLGFFTFSENENVLWLLQFCTFLSITSTHPLSPL